MTTERSTETSTEDLQAGVIRAIFTFVNPLNRFKRRVSAKGKGPAKRPSTWIGKNGQPHSRANLAPIRN